MDHQDQWRKMRPSAKKKPASVKSHYKATKLCEFYRNGACTRGDRCNFAHSFEELKAKPSFHKTRLCTAYLSFGVCRLGSACNFAHSKEEMKEVATQRREQSWFQMSSLGLQATDATTPPAYVPSATLSDVRYWDERVSPATMPPAFVPNATHSELNLWDDWVSPAAMPSACVPTATLSESNFQDEWVSPATLPPTFASSATFSEPNCWDELISPDFLATPWPQPQDPGGSHANSAGPLWMPPPAEDESLVFTKVIDNDGTDNSDEELQDLPLPLTLALTPEGK